LVEHADGRLEIIHWGSHAVVLTPAKAEQELA